MEELKIKVPEVEVFHNNIIASAIEIKEQTDAGIILDAGGNGHQRALMLVQKVLRAGENSVVKEGDIIEINESMLPKKTIDPKHDIGEPRRVPVMPVEVIDGEKYILMTDRYVKYVHKNTTLGELRKTRTY